MKVIGPALFNHPESFHAAAPLSASFFIMDLYLVINIQHLVTSEYRIQFEYQSCSDELLCISFLVAGSG